MYKKVLIAEDIDANSMAIVHTLEELEILEVDYAKYCDDALLKIRKAINDKCPFDLLISDLSFKKEHRIEKIETGEDLITQVRSIQPNIDVIVYSVEEKSYRIRSLFENLKINGFVNKGRKSIGELKTAIHAVADGKEYLSPELSYILKDKTIHEIDKYDVKIIQLLSKGMQQDEIETEFKTIGISPNSKSAIEKRISKLKDYFKANNNVHLIAIAKDLGIT
ncbi:response regulator transcription factor [Flavobacterium sp. CYK-4]|uniref:response regulator transcription factor n=1 Tax=Flavobacterium lotistagni TaxID=2709660 RepID=UPI00140AC3D8|nr:response regulator transcription factor [Flavobacterium lotistagni]NHM05688.1 response regulator transcription factor [Flavobacterium lotistagni]